MLLKYRQLLRTKLRAQKPTSLVIDGQSLRLEDLINLGRGNTKIEIADKSWEHLKEARHIVEKLAQQQDPVYGINTGFGRFSNVKIPTESLIDLQYNLIRSHSTGVGKILPVDASRRVVALRINTLAKGYSGCSLETVQTLVDFFNSGAVPWIPQQGSVGASGDLVPLAHIGLALIGEGKSWNPRTAKYEPSEKVLGELGIPKAEFKAKDGLSLINGTQFICGVGSVALEKAIIAIQSINAIAAMSLLALKGHPVAFDDRIQDIRIHSGQRVVGEIMRELLPMGMNLENQDDVQDPYSLRCMTQVHGPSLEGIMLSKEGLEIEMNSGSDNPLVFTDKEPHIISGGNFHGEFPAKQLDVLAMYTHELASISFMRAKRMMNPNKSLGMPGFLAMKGGVNSGLMTWENVAASLLSENKVLCHPSSIDTAETCADKEDHVSMGAFSARKAITVSENVLSVLAFELMTATHALQYRFQHEPDFRIYHPGLMKVYNHLKQIAPPLEQDRYTVPEYNQVKDYIVSGQLWNTILDSMNTFSHSNQAALAEGRKQAFLHLLQVPKDPMGNIQHTKTRQLQTQLGQLSSTSLSFSSLTEEELKDAIIRAKKQVKGDLASVLDCSQDDLGARANFGRGNASEVTAYDQFLQKFANIQINKHNKDALSSILLLGSVDITDITGKCQGLNPAVPEQRKILIASLEELDFRSRRIVKTVFDSGSKLFYMNGDHNNMGYIVGGFFQSRMQKSVVIYLDVHSDARVKEDGPHSGTWLSEVIARGECQQAYLIGMSLLSNSDAAIQNLDSNNVSYRQFAWDEIQRRGGAGKALPQMTQEIIDDVRRRFGKSQPVILSICADTVCGLPCSASNEVVGYPAEDVYPMMSKFVEELNIECLNVSELKPSLDSSKNNASGEFLQYSLYLYVQNLHRNSL